MSRSETSHVLVKIAFVALIGVCAAGFITIRNQKTPKLKKQEQTVLSLTPLPTESLQPADEKKVDSSDGTKTLLMQAAHSSNYARDYSFFTRDIKTGTQSLLFSKHAVKNETLQVPLNTWSPDNKLVFLLDILQDGMHYLVFKTNGDLFTDKQYIDVKDLFALKVKNYELADVTGWDSETLMHVKTNTPDGTTGPHFWFDVPSQSFIQLAR